jgi:lauroyl/myristoyl acyltransferase
LTWIRYAFEAGAFIAYALFVLPIDWASGLGGWIGRIIGPRRPRHCPREPAHHLPTCGRGDQAHPA